MTPIEFIEKLSLLWGAPFGDRTGEVSPMLLGVLRPFDGATLDKAFEMLFLTSQRKSWPMPFEILNICKLARFSVNPPPLRPSKEDLWSDAHIERADELILCPLGEQAAEGGWLDELWNFCRKTGRIPEGREIDRVCRKSEENSRRLDATIALLQNKKKWKPGSAGLKLACANLAEKMQIASKGRVDRVLFLQTRKAS